MWLHDVATLTANVAVLCEPLRNLDAGFIYHVEEAASYGVPLATNHANCAHWSVRVRKFTLPAVQLLPYLHCPYH